VSDAAFNFTLPRPAVAVVTGGTGSASVAMIAAMSEPATQSTHLSVAAIESLLLRCAGLPLAERRRLPGLPPGRADVFPAALVTLLEIAKLGGIENFTHSTYNLRYGLADEMLG
jgi:exopolyphosphatase/guanosine-5'-triphosphate,3'-diphosphate pyrophosphatase